MTEKLIISWVALGGGGGRVRGVGQVISLLSFMKKVASSTIA